MFHLLRGRYHKRHSDDELKPSSMIHKKGKQKNRPRTGSVFYIFFSYSILMRERSVAPQAAIFASASFSVISAPIKAMPMASLRSSQPPL